MTQKNPHGAGWWWAWASQIQGFPGSPGFQALQRVFGPCSTYPPWLYCGGGLGAALGTANGLRSHPQSNGCLTVSGSGCLGVVAGLVPELRFRRSGARFGHRRLGLRPRACGFSNPRFSEVVRFPSATARFRLQCTQSPCLPCKTLLAGRFGRFWRYCGVWMFMPKACQTVFCLFLVKPAVGCF